MPRILRGISLALLCVTAPIGRAGDIAIATWNLEWLVNPATAHAARLACRSGQHSALPCDVARNVSRDSADLARIAWYAKLLDADVIAFQEVQDASIAQRIFRGYHICIAAGHGVQHVGFAIRPSINHRCGAPMEALSLGGSQRAGMTLRLFPDSAQAVELLSVHLKSGCADAALESGAKSCAVLAAQAKQLSHWIQTRKDTRFVLLGDFNRGDADPESDDFWRELLGNDLTLSPLVFANAGVPFGNCHIGAGFTRAIDHILVSRALAPEVVSSSFRRLGYRESDAIRYRLPDHCPVGVSLNPGSARLSFRD